MARKCMVLPPSRGEGDRVTALKRAPPWSVLNGSRDCGGRARVADRAHGRAPRLLGDGLRDLLVTRTPIDRLADGVMKDAVA